MPFGKYKDMQDCIKNNSDKESPGAYCAQIHKNITGKWPSQKERLKALKESQWTRYADTDEQEDAIKDIERWLKSTNFKYIRGGTSIGKSPQTVILDLTHHGSEIYIHPDGDIKVNDVLIYSQSDFVREVNKIQEKISNKERFVINSQIRKDIIELYHKGLNAKEISRRLRLDLELVEDFLDAYTSKESKQKEAINSSDRKDINEDIRTLTAIEGKLDQALDGIRHLNNVPGFYGISNINNLNRIRSEFSNAIQVATNKMQEKISNKERLKDLKENFKESDKIPSTYNRRIGENDSETKDA